MTQKMHTLDGCIWRYRLCKTKKSAFWRNFLPGYTKGPLIRRRASNSTWGSMMSEDFSEER